MNIGIFVASHKSTRRILDRLYCMFSLSVGTYCTYVDRLLALLLGLRHRQDVTLKQTYVIVVTIWVVSTAFSGMRFSNSVISLWYWIVIIPLHLIT